MKGAIFSEGQENHVVEAFTPEFGCHNAIFSHGDRAEALCYLRLLDETPCAETYRMLDVERRG